LVNNIELVEKFKSVFKLKEAPIAFFYTNNPPQEVYKPKTKSLKHVPCIIQLLNGVRRGRILVLGKKSRHLCPGGLAYLGFRRLIPGLEYYISTGIKGSNGEIIMEGEKFFKTPEFGKALYDKIPFKKSPADYAVFMPLDKVSSEYKPQLVIFYIKMDQLAGLIQLANYDVIENRTALGIGSSCSTIITEPLAELDKEGIPRAIVGMLTDLLSRSHIKSDEASFTVGYERLIQLYENMEGSFLELKSWKKIQSRI